MTDLFINDRIDDSFTKLNKTGGVTRSVRLDDLNSMAENIYPHFDGEVLFDIYYSEEGLKGLSFTEIFSQALLIHPCNDDLRYSMAYAALEDDDLPVTADQVLAEGRLDKYRLMPEISQKRPDAVIFLPGTNVIESNVDWDVVRHLAKEGAFIKPHPITTDAWIDELNRRFPGKVLSKRKSGFDYLTSASSVYTTTNSEMGLLAILLGKQVALVNPQPGSRRPMYRQIYDAVFSQGDHKKALEKIIGSRNAGFYWKWQNSDRPKEIIEAIRRAANV